MNLNKLFTATNPSVVCFINKLEISSPPVGRVPLFPKIVGTGFFIHSDGIAVTNRHVIEIFSQLPLHPKTKEIPIGAILFLPGPDHKSWKMLNLPVLSWHGLTQFTSSERWYGEQVPDIGFVQVGVKDVMPLKLAHEDYYLQIGMDIATIGYPMGRLPLTVLGALHQASPFIRHGIVSSVFPFPHPKPHGFTIDIMQQGGSSGSPILETENGTVVGMMKSSVLDVDEAHGQMVSVAFAHNTNISIAESAHIIHTAFEQFCEIKMDVSNLETLAEFRVKLPADFIDGDLAWDSWTEHVE